jgi:hypothetical protein
MKTLATCIAALFAIGLVNPAFAAPPGKANILHCGCVVDEADTLAMAYIDANVSSKAKGHNKHGAGTLDSCFDGVDTFVDFQRTGDDCQIAGTQLGNLAGCVIEEKEAGNLCGIAAPQ